MFKPFEYKPHDYTQDLLPMPNETDLKLYFRQVLIGKTGKAVTSKADLKIYLDYIKSFKDPSKKDLEDYERGVQEAEAYEKEFDEKFQKFLDDYNQQQFASSKI